MEHQGSQPQSGLAELVRDKWTQRIVYLILVPALLLYALWLPPMSLGARLFHTDYPLVTPDEGGLVPGPEGARLEVPAGAVAKRLRLRMVALTAGDVAALKPDRPEVVAANSLPQDIVQHGPFYRFDARGEGPTEGTVTLPVPYDLSALALAELYGWDGAQWRWLPAQVLPGGTELAAELGQVPSMLVLAQAQPMDLRVAFGASAAEADLAGAEAPVVLHGLTIDSEGNMVGDVPPTDELASLTRGCSLSISNVVGGVARSDWVENIIADGATRKAHIDRIVTLASGAGCAGVEIAYEGLSADARDAVTAFVSELATALHAAGKQLAVRIDPAAGGSPGHGYDWRAIGRAVDVVRVPAFAGAEAYANGGAMDQLLAWGSGQVDRRKLQLVVDTYARREAGDKSEALTYRAALNLLTADISADRAGRPVLPGQSVRVTLPDLAKASLSFDPQTQVYSFQVAGGSPPATIFLETAASVAAKLAYASRYALGGAVLEGALDPGNDQNIAPMARSYQPGLVPPELKFALVWTVEDATARRLTQQVVPLTDPSWTWTAPSSPGNYVISAAVSDDGGQTDLGSDGKLAMLVPTFTPTPTNTPTPLPTKASPARRTTAGPASRPAISNVSHSASYPSTLGP